MRASKAVLLTALTALIGGCAMPRPIDHNTTTFDSFDNRQPLSATDAEGGREVYTDLIRGMLAQGQYYAALAHIQEQQAKDGPSPELRYLEAEARRHLGQTDAAEKLYRSLLAGDFAGQAEHGLGMLYVERDLPTAIRHLQSAVQRRPTDADARNDLGYALMMAGRYGEAMPELSTAVELDPHATQARNNLIILLIANGDETGASRVAAQSGTSNAALAHLRQQAQSLKRRTAANRGGR